MNTKERLLKFLEHLDISAFAFEKKVGISNGYINNMRSSIGPSVLEKIIDHYPQLNKIWLLHEEGDMLNKGITSSDVNGRNIGTPTGTYKSKTKEFIQLSEGKYVMTTPLIQKKAYAGYLTGWGDEEYIEEQPKHSIIVDKPHRGEYVSFEVVGDSMDDGTSRSIIAGSIATGRKIERSFWKSKLHLKNYKVFIIVTTAGILIKEIIEHNVEAGTITIRSFNQDKKAYPDKVVHLEKVMQIFNVVQVTKHI